MLVDTSPLPIRKGAEHVPEVYKVELVVKVPCLEDIVNLELAVRWDPGVWRREEVNACNDSLKL